MPRDGLSLRLPDCFKMWICFLYLERVVPVSTGAGTFLPAHPFIAPLFARKLQFSKFFAPGKNLFINSTFSSLHALCGMVRASGEGCLDASPGLSVFQAPDLCAVEANLSTLKVPWFRLRSESRGPGAGYPSHPVWPLS